MESAGGHMAFVINQFMWGFQRHFRIAARLRMRQALEFIGLQTDVTMVLVGFAKDPRQQHQICVEPENGLLSTADFEGVLARADQLYRSDPDYDLLITDELSHAAYHQNLSLRSRCRAIEEAILGSGYFDDLKFYVSRSARIDDYEVHTCVGVPTDLLAPLPSFDQAMFERIYVGRSLHEEVIEACLRSFDKELHLPDPGADFLSDLHDDDLVTTAARRFVSGTTYRVTKRPSDLFDMVNEFSSMTYERAGAGGNLVIGELRNLEDRIQIRLQEPVPLSEARSMRKLLELTDGETCVLADEHQAYGLGRALSDDNTIQISITGHARWELSMNGRSFVRVAYRHPTIPKRPIARQDFADTIRRIFGDANINTIWELVQGAQEIGHGTTIVISPDPTSETARLSGQALPIVPACLDPHQVARLGGIDGAVLLGPDGRCHAFGVILDGSAVAQGDRARGARFNSSVRYQQTVGKGSVIVVISDDGLVDLIPSLAPLVNREDVERAVTSFCTYSDSENIDAETWSLANDAVEDFEFYLNEEQCRRVNESYDREMRRRYESGGIAWQRQPLRPDPRMDDSYFLESE